MTRSTRMVWRATSTGKELVLLEGDQVALPPFGVNKEELPELLAALQECLGLLQNASGPRAGGEGAAC